MADRTRFEPQRRARRRALQALYQWLVTGQSAKDIIQQFIEAQDFANVDLDLFRSVVEDVIARHAELSERLQPFMDRPLEACDAIERVVLLIGAHQLLAQPGLPLAVVLEECVDLAARFGSAQSPVYVNGVLNGAAHAWRPEAARG